jgi:hypothetical protein
MDEAFVSPFLRISLLLVFLVGDLTSRILWIPYIADRPGITFKYFELRIRAVTFDFIAGVFDAIVGKIDIE